jgi:hypothetical protein
MYELISRGKQYIQQKRMADRVRMHHGIEIVSRSFTALASAIRENVIDFSMAINSEGESRCGIAPRLE